jgi:hypothetical protein
MALHLSLSFNVESISRETYDILNFIGDLGGLNDGLYAICFVLIQSFQLFSSNLQTFSHFYTEYSM